VAIKRTTNQSPPTNAQAEKYELLYPLLKSILFEVKELSKKKQDESLNKLKVGMINKILSQIKNEVLNDDPSREFLDRLDDEMLPTNSDAVLIIAQYEAAMAQFHEKHYGQDSNYKHRWFTKENPGVRK
jgi:ribosome-binding ATPase YchF (GTP1/OBG family)